MGAAYAGVTRQGGELVEGRQHLRGRALKKASATSREKGVAAKKQGCALHVGAVIGDVAGRVARNIQHRKPQAQHLHGVALRQAHQRLGDAFARRAEHLGAGGRAQGIHAADVIGMVVRD